MQNLLDDLTDLLRADKRLVAENRLLKNKVVELGLALDPSLLRLLLSKPSLRKHFFMDVDGVVVFDKVRFQQFVSNKQFLPDSFTAFRNKIGLSADGKYLSDSDDVVLCWPYRDCVLEGGQTKEDESRKEVFWNETLAADQIDLLLAPKALVNFKLFGEEEGKKGKHDWKNLLIRGNNLLALHTLRAVLEKQVKLIYIDPPFNTDTDSFSYNDSFTHSTWLTFMRNRIEAGLRLLRDDGILVVHLDHSEAPYCKVLLDEILGRDNWLNTFTISTNDPSGFKATGKAVFSTANQLLVYAKDKNRAVVRKQVIRAEYDSAYNQVLANRKAPISQWEFEPIAGVVAKKLGFKNSRDARAELKDSFDNEIAHFAFQNADRVFRTAAIQGGARQKRLKTIEKSLGSRGKVFLHPGDDVPNFFILNGEGIIFYEARLGEIDGEKVPVQLLTDIWTDIKVTGIANEGGVRLKNGKKPERLLKRVLEMMTDPGDLVLDYFAGSGTTLAVAHKMQRRYVGIEQLDYEENSAIQRLKNVIGGDQTGISTAVGWSGGGSFLFCELATANEKFVQKIARAKNTKELLSIWAEMREKSFLSHRVEETLITGDSKAFRGLSLRDQKAILIGVLDKNLLYVPLSEMRDESFHISKSDIAANEQFFGMR